MCKFFFIFLLSVPTMQIQRQNLIPFDYAQGMPAPSPVQFPKSRTTVARDPFPGETVKLKCE